MPASGASGLTALIRRTAGPENQNENAGTGECDLPIRTILDRMRHDGCGGRAGRVELLTGIEGASSRPVCKIVLRTG